MSTELSIKITHTIVRICYFFLAISVVVFPFVYDKIGIADDISMLWIFIPYCLVVPAGYWALLSLDRMLDNIKHEIVFDTSNTRALSHIVWACFYAAWIGIIGGIALLCVTKYFCIYFFVLAVGELFMCLICQIVKSVFRSAIELKEENDLTI